MKIQIQTASEVKNSCRIRTLVHETHKRISFSTIVIAVLFIFLHGCSSEEEFDNITTKVSKVEIADFKNWFNSQEIKNGFVNKKDVNWNNVEIEMMPDGETPKVSFEIYKGKNSFGNDSIRELQIVYVGNSYVGGVNVYSFESENEYSNLKYYSLNGRILHEGMYYAPNQQYILLKKYEVEVRIVRLKNGVEYNTNCNGTVQLLPDTPIEYNIFGNPKKNSVANQNAYNCHTAVWGPPSPNDPHYNDRLPGWNNNPNISGSGWTERSSPQVGDRWVSYGYVPGYGNNAPVHSAIVLEVTNGKVTKLQAKMGEKGVMNYHPDCDAPLIANNNTGNIKYYRQ